MKTTALKLLPQRLCHQPELVHQLVGFSQVMRVGPLDGHQ